MGRMRHNTALQIFWEFGNRGFGGRKVMLWEFGYECGENSDRDSEVPAHAIPDRRHDDDLADETLTAFRAYLGRVVGEEAVRLLDRRLEGVSLRQLVGDPTFRRSSAWALRRLMANVRDAALWFARQHGDDEFAVAIERLTDG